MAKKRTKSLAKGKAKTKGRTKAQPKAKARSSGVPRRPRKFVDRRPPPWTLIDPLDTLIEESARALSLPLYPDSRPGVKANLDLTLRLAALFADFPLPDEAEPAPVFVA
jgi:hypothetical protein